MELVILVATIACGISLLFILNKRKCKVNTFLYDDVQSTKLDNSDEALENVLEKMIVCNKSLEREICNGCKSEKL